MHEIHKVRGR